MHPRRSIALLILLATLLLGGCASTRRGDRSLDAFNAAFDDATRRMDNAAILALWADDGISLLPSTPPIRGKSEMAAFLARVTAPLAGARMETFELRCFDATFSGDEATEWCVEHQVVRLPDGHSFDGRGKMLLVLRRARDGRWLLEREMWNEGAGNG